MMTTRRITQAMDATRAMLNRSPQPLATVQATLRTLAFPPDAVAEALDRLTASGQAMVEDGQARLTYYGGERGQA